MSKQHPPDDHQPPAASDPSPSQGAAPSGRPAVLDDAAKKVIVALVRVGLPRRRIAEYVGCSESAIRATAERDEQFGKDIAAARAACEAHYLKQIKKAARGSWRASAWLLTRLRPDQYSPRKPGPFRDARDRALDQMLHHPYENEES
jgi:hypothetical protein